MISLHALTIPALLMYVVSSITFLVGLLAKRQRFYTWGYRILVAAFLIHTLGVVPFVLNEDFLILKSKGDYFFWISWAVPLCYLIFARTLNYPIVGAFVSTATALFMTGSSYLIHDSNSASANSGSIVVFFHALPMLISVVALLFAFVGGSVFLIQESRLKRKGRATLELESPSLQSLDSFTYRSTYIGFLSMTLGLITGSIWAATARRVFLLSDPWQWLSIMLWFVLALVLHLRLSLKWSARRVSKLMVSVTGVFFLCYYLFAIILGGALHAG